MRPAKSIRRRERERQTLMQGVAQADAQMKAQSNALKLALAAAEMRRKVIFALAGALVLAIGAAVAGWAR